MVLKIGTTLLASSDLALGVVGPRGMSLNGRQIIEPAEFFRAVSASFFARDNFTTDLQFTVTRFFPSVRLAEVFSLTHPSNVPRSGVVTAICGEGTDLQTVYLDDAKLAIAGTSYGGQMVAIQYTIQGGAWQTDVPDDLPGSSDAGEDFIVMRRGKHTTPNGESGGDVVFSSPLSAVNSISLTASIPTGGDNVWPIVVKDSVTTAGFSYRWSGGTSDGTWEVNYQAYA